MNSVNYLGIRQRMEEREEMLSPYAVKSRLSRGRLVPEKPCSVRTVFQRDRDRIIHSKSFRRLKHKTQVFIAPLGDHYVTRLTHTLEVSQVARTISRALLLNEDLTEAIALGHDMGHTPFGHVGEAVLNDLYPGGFRHNEQSLRVVDLLENDGRGLNLTCEVREGILRHSKTGVGILGDDWGTTDSLEGQVVKIADIVAYINHDVDDAIRAGLTTESELPISAVDVLGGSRSERINTLVCDIVDCSWVVAGGGEGDPIIGMSPIVRDAAETLRLFLFDRVYNAHFASDESGKAGEVVRFLYHHFIEHPGLLPSEYTVRGDPVERRVVDYIAGMTDQYALRIARDVHPSRCWLVSETPDVRS